MKKIIIEAVEQSGRNKIPELNISDEISFVKLKNDENIYFHTDFLDSTNIKNLEINYTKKINVFV
jgi:16S rRNA U1498 N3-methylase RsmE